MLSTIKAGTDRCSAQGIAGSGLRAGLACRFDLNKSIDNRTEAKLTIMIKSVSVVDKMDERSCASGTIDSQDKPS